MCHFCTVDQLKADSFLSLCVLLDAFEFNLLLLIICIARTYIKKVAWMKKCRGIC
jgi:hypothetical protein